MGQTLFRAECYDRLSVLIQINAVAIFIPRTNCSAESGNPFRLRIPVSVATLRGFYQLINDVLWGRLVWIPHTKVDDVLSSGSRLLL